MSHCWKKRSSSLHLQHPGQKLLVWLKVIQTCLITSQKLGSFAYSSPFFLAHCLQLSNSFFCLVETLRSFQSFSSAAPWQVEQRSCTGSPAFSSYSWLALTPHAGIPLPPPTLGKKLPWIGCCAVKSQPLMGNGGPSESEGGGRREENPAEKE